MAKKATFGGKREQIACKSSSKKLRGILLNGYVEMNVIARMDTRRVKKDGTYPVVISFAYKRRSALIPTGVSLLPEQLEIKDGRVKVSGTPKRVVYETIINSKLGEVDRAIMELQLSGKLRMIDGASELKRAVIAYIESGGEYVGVPSGDVDAEDRRRLAVVFREFQGLKSKSGTRRLYGATLAKLTEWLGGDELEGVLLDDIDLRWLVAFERYMLEGGLMVNTISIHMRNLRAVINYAIDEELTEKYAFRRYKVKCEPTRKRSLSVEQLRALLGAEVTEEQAMYRDMFLLIFMLIGINMVDLAGVKALEGDRLVYTRAKTGRGYSIKVEPEALEIIGRYRGVGHLLDVFDRYNNYKDFSARLNRSLQTIGVTVIGKRGKRTYAPFFPDLTVYWARHSWATIAYSIGISKDVISQALGHSSGLQVTEIYIDRDTRLVDEANRKVIDWVLYGKE